MGWHILSLFLHFCEDKMMWRQICLDQYGKLALRLQITVFVSDERAYLIAQCVPLGCKIYIWRLLKPLCMQRTFVPFKQYSSYMCWNGSHKIGLRILLLDIACLRIYFFESADISLYTLSPPKLLSRLFFIPYPSILPSTYAFTRPLQYWDSRSVKTT